MVRSELLPYTQKLALLYVEDSAVLRNILSRQLTDLFDYVEVAKDGVEGFEQYRSFHESSDTFYDIVITDLEMPNMDGQQLSEKVLDYNPQQEIIVISSINDFQKLVELINLGVKKFVAKPVDEEQLNQVIYDVALSIRHRRLEEQEQADVAAHNMYLKQREEEHLLELQKRNKELNEFREALDLSAVVSKTDLEGNITYVNDTFCKISGYSKEELLGQNHRIVNSGLMSKTFFMKLWRTITAKKTYRALFQNRAKDGTIYYVQALIKPILDVEGEIVEYLSVSYDMTAQIESLKSEQQARKAKDEFFTNISHEMRTPLNAILGFSELMKKRVASDGKMLEMVEAINGSGQELLHLVESILDIRRIKDRSFELKETVFNPFEVFQSCLVTYDDKARKKGQSFDGCIDPEVPVALKGDAERVVQTLGIILDNAVKFTPEGGVIEVHIFYEELGEILVCQVKDSGVGIAKEDQEKIFDFTQADASLNRSHEGAGLGLAIVSSIMSLMKGKISLDSTPGQGSVFMLEIPLQRC